MRSTLQPSSSTPGALAARPTHSNRSGWRRFIWIAVLALIVVLLIQVARIAQSGWTAYQLVSELRTMAQAGSPLEQLPQMHTQVEQLSITLEQLARQVRLFNPLLRRMGWLPTYGPTLAASPDLLVVAQELSALASEGLALVEPALAEADNQSRLRQAVTLLAGAENQLAGMTAHAQAAQQALAAVPVEQLHPLLAQNLAQAQPLLPLLTAGLQSAPSLPHLLGFNNPATYLVLVQNNDELRATGGFISAIGTLHLENADIAGLEFADSYAYMRPDLQYPPAPAPMQRYMNIPLLLVRDANWSPDLPTSAQLIKAMFTHDTGATVQGIVTVDLRAVELLIGGLGPLQIEGADEPISGANVVEQVKQFWTAPTDAGGTIETVGLGAWWGQRKDFIPLLANSALQRLQSGEVNLIALLQATLQALDERAIQVWVDEPAVAAPLAELGWDGGLHPADHGDFLALVDTNMGYNKVDAVLERALHYTVAWPQAGQPALATLTITYTHPLNATDDICTPTPRYGVTYEDLTQRCYFNYLRLYTPLGSELVHMTGVQPDSVLSQRGEGNTQLFAGYFILQPGQQGVVTVQYTLPADLTPANYTLLVQRQSGLRPLPLQLEIDSQTTTTILAEGRFTWSLAAMR